MDLMLIILLSLEWKNCFNVNHNFSILQSQMYTGTCKTHLQQSHDIYNEFMLIVKRFSFPVDFKHMVKLTDITNYVWKQISVFYCIWYIFHNQNLTTYGWIQLNNCSQLRHKDNVSQLFPTRKKCKRREIQRDHVI